MLDQRRRRWADVVQMLYKSFVFAGLTFDPMLGSMLGQRWLRWFNIEPSLDEPPLLLGAYYFSMHPG